MTAYPSVERTSSPKSASASGVSLQNGLTSDEARRRLEKYGPNAMPDTATDPLRMALEKFWAPIPWMLEAAIALQRKRCFQATALRAGTAI
jgi:H+-transporting ATPase